MNIPKYSPTFITAILLLTFSFAISGQTPDKPPKLLLNKPIERSIKGGETHVFWVELKKGEYARAEVEQKDIDVIVSLIDTNGKPLIEMDGDSNNLWQESVSMIAKKGGIYKLQIKGKGTSDNTGSYTAKIAELRKAKSIDQTRIEAEKLLVQAIKFDQQENWKEASVVFEKSLKLWQEIEDEFWETRTKLNLAWSYYFSEQYDKALKLHNEILIVFQRTNDHVGESFALSGIGVIHRIRKEYELARDYLEKSLAIRKELKRNRGEYNTLNALIIIYLNLAESDKLLESLNRMLELSRELRERKNERDTLNLLGLYYNSKFDFEKARPLFEQTLEIDRELNDSEGEIQRLLNLGTVYSKLSLFEKAQKTFEQTIEIARKTNDKKSESNALSELGYYYSTQFKNCDKARQLLIQSLKIKQELPDKAGESTVLSTLVLSSMCLGDNAKIIEYAEKGLGLSTELNDKNGQIGFLQNLGIGYSNTGQIEKAEASYKKALAISRDEKLKFNEAISLLGLANFYELNQQYEETRKLEEQALSIAQELKNNGLINLILGTLGSTHSNLKQYEKSQDYYEQALEVARLENYKDRESVGLHTLGLLFVKLKQFEKAQSYFQQALKISQDNELTYQTIYILSSMGDLYSYQNQLEQAVNYNERSLELARQSKSLNWQTSKLTSLGNVYVRLNKYEKAQIYFEQSVAVAKESGNYANEAIALISLGDLYYRLNQYEKARDYFEQVLKISTETKNRWLLGFATSGMGSVYTDLNQNQKAQDFQEQSLDLMKQVLDNMSEGNVLNSLGRISLNLKEYDKAQKYYEQSLAVAKEIKNKHGEVSPMINLGIVFLEKNQLEKSKSFFEQGLLLAKEVKDRSSEGFAINGLGRVFYKQKKYKEAEDLYNQSLGIAKEVKSKKLEGYVLWSLMELFKETNKPQLAVIYGKQAINIFQEIRGNIKNFDKESQQSYLQDKETAYRMLADLLISESRFVEAQMILNLLKEEEYAQLARSGEKGETIPYSQTEADVLQKIESIIELEKQRDALLKLDNQTAEQEAKSEELRLEIAAANKAFRESLKKLAETEKTAGKRVNEIQTGALQGALSSLKKSTNSGVVAIYTVLGREESKDAKKEKTKFGWVILVTEKVYKAYPIDVTSFNESVFQFRDALSNDLYDPQPLAEKIYDAIFRQKSAKQERTLEDDLREYLKDYESKTIMWSLDGVLRYIPMAALHDGKNYLVEKYRHVIFTEQKFASFEAENQPNWKVLGLGVSEQRGDFVALPGVKLELETIIREQNSPTGILSGDIKINEKFKKQVFFNDISSGKYPVVHIATHYSFNPLQQLESFLLLGEGRLTFGEMEEDLNLFSAVDLLTLSACDTGVSGNGKEAEGFAYKAQQLGAKSIIASLWKVSDAGTPELMIRFYRLRAENPKMSKGEAFRQAQLSLLKGVGDKDEVSEVAKTEKDGKDGRGVKSFMTDDSEIKLSLYQATGKAKYSHPHYWASFVLIGNWK